MINYGKNRNVLAGNFQKTIRFAASLLERLEYLGIYISLMDWKPKTVNRASAKIRSDT